MVDFIVGILNSIGSGVGDDLVADLLKTPAEYNAGMYQLSLTVARSAVKPIASTILAIMCVLELARVSTRADGDRELGVKLVAMAMFKLTLVFTAAQHSELMLQAIDEIGDSVLGGIHSAAPTTGASSGLGLGDSMRDAIDSAGWMGQIPCLILLLIPFLVSKGATIVVTVVILLRFMQIYMLTAFNPLPIAFIAQEETRQWGINFAQTVRVSGVPMRDPVSGDPHVPHARGRHAQPEQVQGRRQPLRLGDGQLHRPAPGERHAHRHRHGGQLRRQEALRRRMKHNAIHERKQTSWRCRCPSTGN